MNDIRGFDWRVDRRLLVVFCNYLWVFS